MFSFIKKFWNFLGRSSKKWILISALAALGLVLTELTLAAALQALMGALGARFDVGTVPPFLQLLPPGPGYIGVALVSIAAIRAGFQLIQAQGNVLIREDLLLKLRQSTLDEILTPHGGFVRSADIQTRLAEIFPKASLCSYHIVNWFLSLLQTVGLAISLFFLSWRDALVAMFGVIIVGMASRSSSIKLRKIGSIMPLAQMRLNEGLQRVARNWLYVKIMRTESLEHKRLSRELLDYNLATTRGAFWTNANGIIAPFLGIILIVIIVHVSQNIWITPGATMISFLYMLVRFVGTLAATVNSHSAYSLNYPHLETALNLTSASQRLANKKIKLEAKIAMSGERVACVDSPPSVVLKNVSKSFDGIELPALHGLSFQVSAGSQLGILGPSGSGKSTLLNIVLGIISPDSGTAEIGGVTAAEAFDKDLFRLGYVGPDPMLIEGSIFENLSYGIDGRPSEAQMWQCLHQVGLIDRIKELPFGLFSQINEHADILSAGQKQRLALARALLNRPSILILDEASANLDEASEASIASVINGLKGSCTTIIVSHRKAFLRYADQVLALEIK